MNIVLDGRAIYGHFAGTPFIQPRLASVNISTPPISSSWHLVPRCADSGTKSGIHIRRRALIVSSSSRSSSSSSSSSGSSSSSSRE